ncbi:BREX-1 system adenine-specific DNA-methyltransferase PglX [Endozoicomonas sp. GU-1]|uniref:BREX-1 system adenine-specific DNA-methyltransferase PglX n=1 Tax=Endozoicomonas sp. GU-1 TaxID=3009078 RepID=UPI0022B4F8A6|nr:BREX-1 system adenine-specific DNA-methyltransferase PglX [Endozoicomonas sp. GU-1]WBA82835.1 BREX-1 system adenine-specific DNA-methyltransferase PglX [Endozoicomonas sp. GU-1]WBA85763.1 BREX-1 system adenine-specific DNA-methyltransferase PglX [Endozoicomonas sp. GU-1]
MKLADHVDSLRELIEGAFDKQFARLGFGKTKQTAEDKLPEEVRAKRERFNLMLASHEAETGSCQAGREKLIDELTFTLFNRLAAIKVMEAASLFRPILTKQMEHGNRSFGHKAWLEDYPHMRDEELEGIRDYIIYAFNELGQTLPLYSKEYPYALLPDPISLNEIIDRFNAIQQDAQVGSDIWLSDDVLGWMYESYNNQKKKAHKDSKAKTEYDKVSLQSQVYTPRWVVEFLVQNSLGKLYLEMYPDSEIKKAYKIANAPETRIRERKPLHEVKIIDPACGSGNFLLYAFDFYYALYQDQIDNYGADYEEKDIPRLIIENNLHGIDLDDRAVQLAQLGLYIKARKKRRTIGELSFKVVSSDFYLPNFNEVRTIFEDGSTLQPKQKELIEKVWSDLRYAYKFGSLIHIDELLKQELQELEEKAEGDLFGAADVEEHKDFASAFFTNLSKAVEKFAKTGANTFLTSKTRDAITFLELLTTEYDIAAANPPYTDSADFGHELKIFIENNYKKPYKFHTNLYATFIKRCCELTSLDGKVAMVHPPTFMYIKSFIDVRKYIIENTGIDIFIEWGYLGMFHSSARVDSAMYVLDRCNSNNDASFIKLNNVYEGKRYEAFVDSYTALINGIEHKNNYSLHQNRLKKIKTWPFIYWISDEFREKFGTKGFGEYFNAGGGLTSANNDRFLRFWWEVDRSSLSKKVDDARKWRNYVKGGPFNRWYGNIWTIVNWEDNGYEIRTFTDVNGKPRATLRSEKFYFKEGITFAKSGSKGASFRYMPENTIIDSGSPGIYSNIYDNLNYAIAFLNSKLAFYILSCLNPTVSTQVGDVERIPFVIPPKKLESKVQLISRRCIDIKKHLCKFSLFEQLFEKSPLLTFQQSEFKTRIKGFLNHENYFSTQILINEALINEIIFKIYNLTEHDETMVIEKEGPCVGSLPINSEARDAFMTELDASNIFSLHLIADYLEKLPVKDFEEEERASIENRFSTLYQSNNNFEEFCIRYQVNPINIWYWFKQISTIPKQRMNILSMEFLADMIREILMKDEDGIIPLVPNAGEKVLLDRIEETFQEKSFTSAQYSSFDSVLGRPINDYINKYFFEELTEHLNLFQYLPKTPFIWHLTSGPEQGFDCYIIIYKWNRDKLMRLRSVYIENRERALANRQSDLSDNESAEAQNEKARIFKQLKEIDTFKKKIDELLAEGYNPILDDGVGKNIAPLQQKKMLAYDVLNASQLKKYLNADW